MATVDSAVCELKHDQIGRDMDLHGATLADHTRRIYAVEGGAALQIQTNNSLLAINKDLDERVKKIEGKPLARLEKILDDASRWGILLLLGLLAAKLGLS